MDSWRFLPFEDALQKVTYTKKIPKKQFLEDGAYPIISQESDFINGYWDNAEDVFSVDSPVVIFGDHTKIIKHIDFDFVLGADGVKILKPIEALNSKFFAYFLNAAPVADLGYARHYRLLKEITVPVPPLEEQKRIVAILDEVFADIEQARAKTEQNLKNARELFESYLQQVFSQRGEGWVEKTLGDVCKFENGDRGKNYPSRSNFVESGFAFINAGHIDDGIVDFSKMNYITEKNYDLLSRGKIKKGDILFCLRGSLGKFAVIEDDTPGAIASSLVIVRPHSDLSISFLLHYLRSGLCKSMIEKYAGGAAQPNLGAKDLAKFSISVPPADQQIQTSDNLNRLMSEVESLEFVYSEKLTALDELKQSILQKAFSGELIQGASKEEVA